MLIKASGKGQRRPLGHQRTRLATRERGGRKLAPAIPNGDKERTRWRNIGIPRQRVGNHARAMPSVFTHWKARQTRQSHTLKKGKFVAMAGSISHD